MEFSHLLAELKNAAEEYGAENSENALDTSKFCQTVCKVADNLEKHISKYENQVTGLWVIFGYVTELYPRLEKGSATTSLCQKLFHVSARIVLDVQWGQLDEEESHKNNFKNTLTAFHQILWEREGASRFSVILSLLETHWTHPILGQVMSSEEDDEEGQGLAYITSEDPDILRLRVEMMLQQNCEEFALNLCTWCLKHPALKCDLDIRQIQLTLMDKLHDLDRLQEEAESITPSECVALVQRFMELPKNQKVCTVLTQTFLVQNWIKEGNDSETIELFKLWIKHQYMVDEDEDKFISNLWAIAKLSRTTEQITVIIDCIREKCGDSLLQFYTDMCVYAINIDKSVLENSIKNGEMSEIQTHQQDMSLTCSKLADIFRTKHLKTARYSIVTAFSLNPSKEILQTVASFYKSDNPSELIDTGQKTVAKCCGNCTFNRGECTQKNTEEKEKINPATLYEVERLLNMLRPYNLKPDLPWIQLGPACAKYLQERERIVSLMAEAEAKKKAQPNQLSHQQLAASLREKLLTAGGHNKASQKNEPKHVPPKPKEEVKTEPKSYASNLQQVVENLQKRLGKSPVSSHTKVLPRTGQSINLANNNSVNVMNTHNVHSANRLPTASEILAQKKSDAESIRQRTTQQIAATIQQTFLRNQPEKPAKFMVQVHNHTVGSPVPSSSQQPPQFISRPQELNSQYIIKVHQQQSSKVRMLKHQQMQSQSQNQIFHQPSTIRSPQQIIHQTIENIQTRSATKVPISNQANSTAYYSNVQTSKATQSSQGIRTIEIPPSHAVLHQGIPVSRFQTTRPQIIRQQVPATVNRVQVPSTHIQQTSPVIRVSQTANSGAQYSQVIRQPNSQQIIQTAKNQLYALSHGNKTVTTQQLMGIPQKQSVQHMISKTVPASKDTNRITLPMGNFTTSAQNVYQSPPSTSSTVQFQQAQQMLQIQSPKSQNINTSKARGLPITSSTAHQATLALADKSKLIRKRPLTGSQVQLLSKAEAQGYASGKAVVKILQSQGVNKSPTTTVTSSPFLLNAAGSPINRQQIIGIGSPQQLGTHAVSLNQTQQVLPQTLVNTTLGLPASTVQQFTNNQQIYQQHSSHLTMIPSSLNPVQTDLNTLLSVASVSARSNSSQTTTVMPSVSSTGVCKTLSTSTNSTLSVQSDLSSIIPTIPQLDSQQFHHLQNQVKASQSQQAIPTPNLSAQQLQDELNKINQHSQQAAYCKPTFTTAVRTVNQHSFHTATQPKLNLNQHTISSSVQHSPSMQSVKEEAPCSSNPQTNNTSLSQAESFSSTAPQLHKMLSQPNASHDHVPSTSQSNSLLNEQTISRPAHDLTNTTQSSDRQSDIPDKYAEEQKNIFVKSLLNASDEILETLSSLPDTTLITDLFKNANPGDELHIALSNNLEDLGIEDVSTLVIPDSDRETTVEVQEECTDIEQEQVSSYTPVRYELDPAAQSLRDVQGIHIPEYNEQYENLQENVRVENSETERQISPVCEDEPAENITKTPMLSKQCGTVFKCIICSSVFSSLDTLQMHVQRVCKPDNSASTILHDSLRFTDGKSSGVNAKTIYQCVKCSTICISEKEMQLHTKNCPKDNSHLLSGNKKYSEHSSVLPSANKEYQSVKKLVARQQIEIKKEMKAKKEKEQQLKKIKAQRVLQKQKELKLKRESEKLAKAPPPPRYKEMSSSSGKTFYKCELCGQTVCSLEGVHDHWVVCWKKNAISKKVRRPSVVKQKMIENPEKFTAMMSNIFDSVVGSTEVEKTPGEDKDGEKNNKEQEEIDNVSGNTRKDGADKTCLEKDDEIPEDVKDKVKVNTNDEMEKEEREEKSKDENQSDSENDKYDSSQEDDEKSDDTQSSVSTDVSESTRSLRHRKVVKTPKYFFSSDSDEDLRKAKKLSQQESSSSQILPEVELARLKKNSTCSLCSVKLKDMTIKLQHFAVKHLKIHTHARGRSGHSFLCHLCKVSFNVYTKYVFHLKDHETDILKKIALLMKSGDLSIGNASSCLAAEKKSQIMAARKSVKKHLSPSKKSFRSAVLSLKRTRGRPRKIEKSIKENIENEKEDDDTADDVYDQDKDSDISEGPNTRRRKRAAHAQALNKIKNNANGFDILNTLPHFSVDLSSSGHSRSCSPENKTKERKLKKLSKESKPYHPKETDEDYSSDKETVTEESSESLDSQDEEVKLTDLEAELENSSDTSEVDQDSTIKFTSENDSQLKDVTSEDSQMSSVFPVEKVKSDSKESFMSSFLTFLNGGKSEEKFEEEQHNRPAPLHGRVFKDIKEYKRVFSQPLSLCRERHSIEESTEDSADSIISAERSSRKRRLSDSELLLQHKHLLNNTELKVVLEKLPEELTADESSDTKEIKVPDSTNLNVKENIVVSERPVPVKLTEVNTSENSQSPIPPADSPMLDSVNTEVNSDSPVVSEVSSRAVSEEVEVLLMKDSSPSMVISCLLGGESSNPEAVFSKTKRTNDSATIKTGNEQQDSNHVVKIGYEHDDNGIIVIEKNSDNEDDYDDDDEEVKGSDEAVNVDASLTTCVIMKAGTPPDGERPSSGLIIIENTNTEVVDSKSGGVKNSQMTPSKEVEPGLPSMNVMEKDEVVAETQSVIIDKSTEIINENIPSNISIQPQIEVELNSNNIETATEDDNVHTMELPAYKLSTVTYSEVDDGSTNIDPIMISNEPKQSIIHSQTENTSTTGTFGKQACLKSIYPFSEEKDNIETTKPSKNVQEALSDAVKDERHADNLDSTINPPENYENIPVDTVVGVQLNSYDQNNCGITNQTQHIQEQLSDVNEPSQESAEEPCNNLVNDTITGSIGSNEQSNKTGDPPSISESQMDCHPHTKDEINDESVKETKDPVVVAELGCSSGTKIEINIHPDSINIEDTLIEKCNNVDSEIREDDESSTVVNNKENTMESNFVNVIAKEAITTDIVQDVKSETEEMTNVNMVQCHQSFTESTKVYTISDIEPINEKSTQDETKQEDEKMVLRSKREEIDMKPLLGEDKESSITDNVKPADSIDSDKDYGSDVERDISASNQHETHNGQDSRQTSENFQDASKTVAKCYNDIEDKNDTSKKVDFIETKHDHPSENSYDKEQSKSSLPPLEEEINVEIKSEVTQASDTGVYEPTINTDSKSENSEIFPVPEVTAPKVKEQKETDSTDNLPEALKISCIDSIPIADSKFVRSVSHSVKLLTTENSSKLKLVDYSESDSELDSDLSETLQQPDIVAMDDGKPNVNVTEMSLEGDSSVDQGQGKSSILQSIAETNGEKEKDKTKEETTQVKDKQPLTASQNSKEKTSPADDTHTTTSIASKDFSAAGLPSKFADNLNKMPKIGSTVVSQSGNTFKVVDVKITKPQEKKEQIEEEVIPEECKRSGLIQSLREQIKVEPFKWDDEDEVSSKQYKNEQIDKAVTNKSNTFPLIRDALGGKQSSGRDSPAQKRFNDARFCQIKEKTSSHTEVTDEVGENNTSKCQLHVDNKKDCSQFETPAKKPRLSDTPSKQSSSSQTVENATKHSSSKAVKVENQSLSKNSRSSNKFSSSPKYKPPRDKLKSPIKNEKCLTRSSSKPNVRTSERQRLRQMSPNKYSRSGSPLKKSLNRLCYKDNRNNKHLSASSMRLDRHSQSEFSRNHDQAEKRDDKRHSRSQSEKINSSSSGTTSHCHVDKPIRSLKRESSENDLHSEKKQKISVDASSTCSEASNSDSVSPVRRSKRRLDRLHRKLCCNEDHKESKKPKLDESTCHHGPSSTCSSCVHCKKSEMPLPAVVRRSANYRRHTFQNVEDTKKIKNTPPPPPTRNVTMVRVECDGPIKDSRGRPSDKKRQSDQDNKWKFRPRNKNKKYPYTYTRAREKE